MSRLSHRSIPYVGALTCGLALTNQHTIVLLEAPLIMVVLVTGRDKLLRYVDMCVWDMCMWCGTCVCKDMCVCDMCMSDMCAIRCSAASCCGICSPVALSIRLLVSLPLCSRWLFVAMRVSPWL